MAEIAETIAAPKASPAEEQGTEEIIELLDARALSLIHI